MLTDTTAVAEAHCDRKRKLVCTNILTRVPEKITQVLYMSFDKFILTVESRDLSQADKSIIRVFSFQKLFLNDKIYSYTKKTTIWHNYLAKLMFWSILSFKNLQD